jgi:hypothetical protein
MKDHDKQFRRGAHVQLNDEFKRITGQHGTLVLEGRSLQSDGDGVRVILSGPSFSATVPEYALRQAHV